jgi:GT2 family glycosyltransferase
MARPFLSVLIVNYNGAAHLRACLAALAVQSLPRDRFEVIVLDNASADGSAAIVNDFPFGKLVRSNSNLGFAEGNNVAKSYARGEWLVLLNPDTEADPHCLAELADEIEHSGADRVACKLVTGPEGRTINSGGIVLLRTGWACDDGFRETDDGRFESPRDVFGGCGAAVAVPNRPGPLFPADYFAYYEDTQAAWRERQSGGRTWFAPRAVVRHDVGASAGEHSPRFTFLTERNRILTTATFADPFLAGFAVAKGALKSLLGWGPSRGPHATARLRALGSFVMSLPRTLVRRYDARSAFVGGTR